MKKFLFLLILSSQFIFYKSFSQAPSWLWAKSSGSGYSEEGLAIAVDANGYSYITGHFNSPTILFGSSALFNAGGEDVFVAKYDPSGNVVWAKSAGGTSADRGNAIAVDANGNCYVTGYFLSSSISFGSTVLSNAGGQDIFTVKYNSAGTVVWAKSEGGSADDDSRGIAVDTAGNCYITGNFGSPSITLGGTTYLNSGVSDMFILKYDSNGTVVWSNSSGGVAWESGNGIAVDASGNSFVTGSFASATITFGTNMFYCSGALEDVFVVKYDAAGNVAWAQSEGGNMDEVGIGIALDTAGNCFVNGYFQSSPIMIGSITVNGAGSYDMFVAKYDAGGNVLWAKPAGGTLGDNGFGIASDAAGNCYAIGSFMSPTVTLGTTTLTNASSGSWDMYIVKYDPSGTVLWAKSAGGIADDRCYGVNVNASGHTHIVGYFQSSTIAFGTSILTNADSSDVFSAVFDTTAITGIDNGTELHSITNIFPNPVLNSATISFSLSQSQDVSIKIRDVSGRLVAILAEGTFSQGGHQIAWNAGNVEDGMYLLQFQSSGILQTEKVIVTNK